MNSADRIVNIKACIKATNNSIAPMNKAKGTDTNETNTELNTKIKPISASTKMWPAVIFANKRIANAIGLVKIPMISTGTNTIYNHHGTDRFDLRI